ncbi:uncharacterized protein C18orf19 homolog A isoform X1 [Polypterus senegalus]|uniref:uncharacterized protein C18orf19 homolog A isoform X1 n=1 Tax=Polypterus senegalus TaxID=55291 RepID=UPI0019646D77|nr:uncharacterized protein C18orf19 homolog A isoform X1 [Polypterus senegalus]XP_039593785.1 uncharacterized protein C18orf19 homolog A isoform X1 [Polypterus senegalus]XP_039593787.1 uncharacterized protein C18orf19 homolog A isoform X1 [Polypterus senegalus]XP_039593788.1 uncharacterized protein C18orf19 homolog A isoform X1 [Polypterus senegalus]
MQGLLLKTVLHHARITRSGLCCLVPHKLCKGSPDAFENIPSISCRWLTTSFPRSAAEEQKKSIKDQTGSSNQEKYHVDASEESKHFVNASGKPNSLADSLQEENFEKDPLSDQSIGIVQRFKKTFKQYGKVMIPVHILTSTMWFGSFYYAAMKGVNLVPFLEYIGMPENLVHLLRDSQSGYALTAYAMYKIATPARYTVTLGGTSYTVKYLRKHGYFSTPPPVRDYIQDKMEETRERFTEKMEETKDRFSEKMEETKDKISETKEKLSERFQETKSKVGFRKKKD